MPLLLFIILLILLLGGIPPVGLHEWGTVPSGLGLVIIILLILALMGRI